jgi:hypothetical protein
VQEGSATRTSQASLSAALAAAHAGSPQDGSHSLAEMAYRDLDATLQLLADRAQYITGSTGAAIALRRIGKSDMLCRASSGVNAPELGALLSSEFGLSGESVRRRQILRCDDAERDVRVNRDVCRRMGIASVVVMPVVHDDEVLGVFELFSGKVNAFGERDLSALQRLSEMVETAVKLAHAAAASPDRFKHAEPAADAALREIAEEPVLEVVTEAESLLAHLPEAARGEGLGAVPKNIPSIVQADANNDVLSDVGSNVRSDLRSEVRSAIEAAVPEIIRAVVAGEVQASAAPAAAQPAEPDALSPAPAVASELTARHGLEAVTSTLAPARKPLLWSAASVNSNVEKSSEPDQSHVPMGLRNLRKCEACGFPVSASRVLCVECEEKKWRGQLTIPQKNPVLQSTVAAASSAGTAARLTPANLAAANLSSAKPVAASGAAAPLPGTLPGTPSGTLSGTLSGLAAPPRVSPPETRAFAATAHAAAPAMAPRSAADVSASAVGTNTMGTGTMSAGTSAGPATGAAPARTAPASSSSLLSSSLSREPAAVAASPSHARPAAADLATAAPASGRSPQVSPAPEPELVLSAGLAPRQSWFASNKYIVGALLVVAALVAVVFILR